MFPWKKATPKLARAASVVNAITAKLIRAMVPGNFLRQCHIWIAIFLFFCVCENELTKIGVGSAGFLIGNLICRVIVLAGN